MNVLSRLWRAVAGLAESVEALAGTVNEANGRPHAPREGRHRRPAAYFNSGCWAELPCTYLTVCAGVVRL